MKKNFKLKLFKLRKKYILKRRKSSKRLYNKIYYSNQWKYQKSLKEHQKLIDNKEIEIFLTEILSYNNWYLYKFKNIIFKNN